MSTSVEAGLGHIPSSLSFSLTAFRSSLAQSSAVPIGVEKLMPSSLNLGLSLFPYFQEEAPVVCFVHA